MATIIQVGVAHTVVTMTHIEITPPVHNVVTIIQIEIKPPVVHTVDTMIPVALHHPYILWSHIY